MRIIFCVFTLIALAGCSAEGTRKLPGVYRLDIQQGNVIEPEMLNKLKPGMVKDQVQFIMGTPTIVDPFHDERWDYLYTYSKGGGTRQQRHIIIYFKDDKLAYLEGGIVPGIRRPPEEFRKKSKTVEVPIKQAKKGFLSKLINVLPFIGADEPKPRAGKPAAGEPPAQNKDAAPPEVETGEPAEDESGEPE